MNNSASTSGGTVYLAYGDSTGRDCVVVRSNAGAARNTDAVLEQSASTSWTRDPGDRTSYAGPVYLEAAGQCVDRGGVIGDVWVVRNATNRG